jgi:hypothetical protein
MRRRGMHTAHAATHTQVEAQHVHYELSAAKFSWDHPRVYSSASRLTSVTVVKDPYEACKDAHAICVLTGRRSDTSRSLAATSGSMAGRGAALVTAHVTEAAHHVHSSHAADMS